MNDKLTYTLNCEVCGGVFYSEEGFPIPQLCSKCSEDKELVEKCLLTVLELWNAYKKHPEMYKVMAAINEQVIKAIPIIRKELTEQNTIEYVEGLVKRARKDYLGLSDGEQVFLSVLSKIIWDMDKVRKEAYKEVGEWLERKMIMGGKGRPYLTLHFPDVITLKQGELPQ